MQRQRHWGSRLHALPTAYQLRNILDCQAKILKAVGKRWRLLSQFALLRVFVASKSPLWLRNKKTYPSSWSHLESQLADPASWPAASTQLVNDFAGAVDNRLVARLQPEFADLVSDVKTFIQDTVVDRLRSIRGSIPSLPVPPVAEEAADKIRDNLQAILDSKAQELAAAIRASAQARVNQLKAQLASFGDIAFHEPLRRLLDSCKNEARLNSTSLKKLCASLQPRPESHHLGEQDKIRLV